MATAARTKRKTDRKKRSCEKRSSPCIDLYFLAVSVVRFAGEVRSLFLVLFFNGRSVCFNFKVKMFRFG
jgi:hypothetical protein